MLRLKALDHVALRVTDMERTRRFYRDALGLEVVRVSAPSIEGERSAVIRIGAQEINVFQHPGFAPIDDGARVGMDHLCLAVEARSIDELIAGLRRAEIPLLRGPVQRRDGVSVFVRDPDGVRVELRLPT